MTIGILDLTLTVLGVLLVLIVLATLIYVTHRLLKNYYGRIVMAEYSVIEEAREQERRRMEKLMVQQSMANMAAVAEGAARGAGQQAARGVIDGAHLYVKMHRQLEARRARAHHSPPHAQVLNELEQSYTTREQSYRAPLAEAKSALPPQPKSHWLAFWKRT